MEFRSLTELHGPPGWPLIGNVLELDVTRLHLQLEAWARLHGESYTFRIGTQRFLVISNLDASLAVLKERPHAFRRLARIESVLDEMGGNGVLSAEGAEWQRQRRLVTKAMTPRQIEEGYPAIRTITCRLLERWSRAAHSGQPSDMIDDLTRYTVDTTMVLLFGRDLNTLETAGEVIQEHINRIPPMLNARINAPFPYWHYVKFAKDRQLDRALEATMSFCAEMIEQSRQSIAKKPAGAQRTLLEAMVELRDEPGSEFSESDLLANIVTLLLTGEDTTAYTLAWSVHTLASDPSLQAFLCDAAQAVMGDERIPESYRTVAALEILEGFVLEVLRRRPATPVLSLEAVTDTVVDGIAVPAGTPVLILTRPAGLDGRYFGDPGAIRPERWTSGGNGGCAHDTRAFLHFGAGPRFCPGRHLSLIEMKTVTAMLVRNFEVAPAEGSGETEEIDGFTMRPSRLRVQFSARE